MKNKFLLACLLVFTSACLLTSCSTTAPVTGKLTIRSIEVSSNQIIFRGTLKGKGLTPEQLQKAINDASQGIFSIDKLYVVEADTSANADFTLITPNPAIQNAKTK